ncbi:PAAR domain-containing protein [Pseudomonas xanthosomatis]|uniref:PAAR domain-containing protein n=1 Tax=Pseudomonas xanthosomatis TaxID=2842356 RepID=UPI001C3C785B|nr:PAAR domain-containing protein [Pseudomonas xanthosomatis]QXH47785.1 PAAR domain-containing protein [Pseudomonas xanthosomatis]
MAKPAARVSDTHSCPIPGHVPNPIAAGSGDVIAEGMPVATVGHACACGGAITQGMPTVFVNGQPVAYLGSPTSHGGSIISGAGTVLVGSTVTPAPFSGLAPMPRHFNEHFALQCADTGEPLAGRAYTLTTASGRVLKGITDSKGRTQTIGSSQAQAVHLEFEPQTEVVLA